MNDPIRSTVIKIPTSDPKDGPLFEPNSILRVYIKPAAKKIGLTKRIGSHTFRRTFRTIFNANGENPKVIQELLRHANLRVTMDTYVQAMSDEKRKAQSKVVEMIMPGIRKAAR